MNINELKHFNAFHCLLQICHIKGPVKFSVKVKQINMFSCINILQETEHKKRKRIHIDTIFKDTH